MQEIDLDTVPSREVFPGFVARMVHSANMTFAHWHARAGASVPEHSHPHEQVVSVSEGVFELTVAGQPHRMTAGKIIIVPGGVKHSGRAMTDCRIMDVFYPIREDYR